MRVRLVHSSNDHYGASRALLGEVDALRMLGHEPSVLVPTAGPLGRELAERGVPIRVERKLVVARRARLGDMAHVPRLGPLIDGVDAVCLWTLPLALYAPLLRAQRVPFYLSVHESVAGRAAGAAVWLLARGTFPVQANSEATRTALLGRGVAEGRLHLSYPVVELAGGAPRPRARTATGLDVAVVGRVNGQKGHLEVARAVRRLNEGGRDCRGWFAGTPYPGQEGALTALLEEVAESDALHYLGELDSLDQLPGCVNLIAVFPAAPEPFGLVPLEALRLGIPSVGYGDGGAAEVLALCGGQAVERASSSETSITDALLYSLDHYAEVVGRLPAPAQVQPSVSVEQRAASLVPLLDELGRPA